MNNPARALPTVSLRGGLPDRGPALRQMMPLPATDELLGDELRFVLEHGYEVQPWPDIAQVLWFAFGSLGRGERAAEGACYFWIEHASGAVQAVTVTGLESAPEAMIPCFAGAAAAFDEQSLTAWLRAGWIFPPDFSAKPIARGPVIPAPAFLASLLKDHVAAQLARIQPSHAVRNDAETLLNLPAAPIGLIYDGYGLHFAATGPQKTRSQFPLPPESEAFLADARQFGNRLSADILSALARCSEEFSLQNYNTAAAWAGEVRRNRLQAIHLAPWLAGSFGLQAGLGETHLSTANPRLLLGQDVVEAIDKGERFEHLLAQRCQVQRHTLRSVARLLKIRHFHPRDIPALLWFLDGIKVDLRPRDQCGLRAFWPTLEWIYRWRLDSDPAFLKRLGQEVFGDGLAGARRRFRQWCPSHRRDDPYADLEDFLSDHADAAGYEHVTAALYGRLFMAWVHGQDFGAFFTASEQWHTARWAGTSIDKTLTWPSLLASPLPVGQLVAHELSDAALLQEEGRAMHHCIASYAASCVAGNQFVFSLRTARGKRRATVLIVKDPAQGFHIHDHRGFANADPDSAALEAADRLLDYLGQSFRG